MCEDYREGDITDRYRLQDSGTVLRTPYRTACRSFVLRFSPRSLSFARVGDGPQDRRQGSAVSRGLLEGLTGNFPRHFYPGQGCFSEADRSNAERPRYPSGLGFHLCTFLSIGSVSEVVLGSMHQSDSETLARRERHTPHLTFLVRPRMTRLSFPVA